MSEKKAIVAGLVVENSGQIIDCYTIWNNNYSANGRNLVIENTGVIACSLLSRKGSVEQIYNKEGALQPNPHIEKNADLAKYNFDTHRVWHYVGGKSVVRFAGNWHGKTKDDRNRKIVHIRTADEYIIFADKVNSKQNDYINAKVIIDDDIDFKGKVIPVIGKKRECAFAGIFDGADHMLWNAKVSDSDCLYVAPFGYMKGTVLNVVYDCRVAGSSSMAGLVGYNMGTILSSGAIVRIHTKDDRSKAGCIATVNEGKILNSYGVFEPNKAILPIIPIMGIIALVCAGGIFGYQTTITAEQLDDEYVAIETDPDQEEVDDIPDIRPAEPVVNEELNQMEFEFDRNMYISRAKGVCQMKLINSFGNDTKIVARLEIEDVDGNRQVVATTKAISPGYQMKSMRFSDIGKELLDGSQTEGFVVLVPYNTRTEARAGLEAELPVVLEFVD